MRRIVKGVIAALGVLAIAGGNLSAAPILAPGDFIIAIDHDNILPTSTSNHPGGEPASAVVDGNSATKYLNFATDHTGFIVTPTSGSSQVQSFTLTTGGDAPERDPRTWHLFGTNDAVTSTNNSAGNGENWTFIDAGSVSLPCCDLASRQALGPVVSVSNANSYSSYMMVFPFVRDNHNPAPNANSMQVADARFYQSTDGSGTNVLGLGGTALAVQRLYHGRYPELESPALVIDGDANTKYLNFGKENSGFIVTPQSGPATVLRFQITTANDASSRDPSSWELYGTDDPIGSHDMGRGNVENWTLVDSGSVELPLDRLTAGPYVTVNGTTPYTSYKMVFTGQRDPNAGDADSMQYSEVQFFSHAIPEPSTIALATLALLGCFCARYRRRG